MADQNAAPLPGPSRIRSLVQRFIQERGGALLANQEPVRLLKTGDGDGWDGWLADPVTQQILAGTVHKQVRSRQQVYQKWQDMLADAVVTTALRNHVTAALGGHETRGEMVFIETAATTKDARAKKMVAELARDLQPMFNRVAPTVGFNGCAFGDAYARVYAEDRVGVRDLNVDELMYPPLVQPYERGSTTVGYQVSTGSRFYEKLSIMQVARMKMPRTMYIPQDRVVEKSVQINLRADKLEDLPAVPSTAGGSFLDGAEKAYDNLSAALASLIGSRARASIDESIIQVNLTQTTKEQQSKILTALQTMLQRSHDVFTQVAQSGRAAFGKLFHVIPVNNEKQVAEVRDGPGSSRTGEYTVEDVMTHARFLAGALGTDLSMLGFSDQLSGGLGDGGFFRVSVQSAERSRAIRAAMTEFFDHIISIHVLLRYGLDYFSQEKPWSVTYYSGISALETERQKTRADNMASAQVLAQVLEQLKGLGLDEATNAKFLKDECGLDEPTAKAYAKALATA